MGYVPQTAKGDGLLYVKVLGLFFLFQYMIVQPDEDPKVIVNALTKKWNLHFPKLLICILGGSEVTLANQAIEKTFSKGLVEAVLGTG